MQVKRFFILVSRWLMMVGIVLTLGACSKQSKQASGGVDGSGGQLRYFEFDSFADWLKNEHPAYVRDVLHRLILVRKSGQDDFKFDEDLAAHFFGADPDQLMELAGKIKFVAVKGACPSSNHPSGDAAVYPDGSICFSYNAFKNFPIEVELAKLLILTLHEISHLRGFNEDDAVKWQLKFEPPWGFSGVILTGNSDYKAAHSELAAMSDKIGWALKSLLSREENAKRYACERLARADEHVQRYFLVDQALPHYLDKKAHNAVTAMGQLASNCWEMSEQEIARAIPPVLQAFSTAFIAFEQFESPFCTGNICAGRRPYNPNADYMLMAWSVLEKSYTAKAPYTKPSQRPVCEVHDVASSQIVPLEWKDGSANLPLGNSKHRLTIGFFSEDNSFDKSFLPVNLSHDGPFQLVEGQGFVASSMFGIDGILKPGSVEKIHARIALMDGHPNPDKKNQLGLAEPDISYFMFDPFLMGIRNKPTIENQFDIDCWLQK